MLKKLFLYLTAATLLVLPLTVSAKTFSDVNENTNYSIAIYSNAEDGVINGYPDGTFRPDQCVNRAELLKMLFLANKTELYSETGTAGSTYYDNYFSDTNKSEWYWPYVNTALRKNVIQGYSDKTFRPGNCVNRAEAIKMALTEFRIKTEVTDLGSAYIDLDAKAWYFPYVFTALRENFVGLNHVTNKVSEAFGPEQKYYYPAGAMTRAEVAQMIFQISSIRQPISQNSTTVACGSDDICLSEAIDNCTSATGDLKFLANWAVEVMPSNNDCIVKQTLKSFLLPEDFDPNDLDPAEIEAYEMSKANLGKSWECTFNKQDITFEEYFGTTFIETIFNSEGKSPLCKGPY